MEVTPHLKTVLKNYQHSATKSLQGPGHQVHQVLSIKEPPSPVLSSSNGGGSSSASSAASSPIKDEQSNLSTGCCYNQPAPALIQQPFPILTAADTTCSERTETVLESQTISCFVVGGERRLCLPQVLNSVLRKFALHEINQECDQLQIYCSRCTLDQLNVLKNHGILPSTAPSCGLITKTDAERLCSSLLLQNSHKSHSAPTIRKGAMAFSVYHRCFGKGRGLCIPELYTGRGARCIECQDCRALFSPQQFVCHAHRDLENRTVHWGFDSAAWRAYLLVTRLEQQPPAAPGDETQCGKYLDDMWDRYEGRATFPSPISPSNGLVAAIATAVHHKRKLLSRTSQDLVNIKSAAAGESYLNNNHSSSESTPALKKNKLMETNASVAAYVPLPTFPHNMFQQMDYSNYMNYINIHHPGSAFNPIVRPLSLKETKLRQTIALNNIGYQPAKPTENGTENHRLSNGESTVNGNGIALTPATPKKYRYFNKSAAIIRTTQPLQPPIEVIKIEKEDVYQPDEVSSSVMKDTLIKEEKINNDEPTVLTNGAVVPSNQQQQHSPDSQSVIDSTVSVVQSTRSLNRYNSEIELSTDTDDTCSEISERATLTLPSSIEEALKGLQDVELRERVMSMVRRLKTDYDRELDERDMKVKDLERQVVDLQEKLGTINLHNNNVHNGDSTSSIAEMMHQDESTTSAVIEETKILDEAEDELSVQEIVEVALSPTMSVAGDSCSSSNNKPGVITAAVVEKVSLIETTDGDK